MSVRTPAIVLGGTGTVKLGVSVTVATAINNQGQIVATASANGRSFAALLTPAP